jgi:urea carboxylase
VQDWPGRLGYWDVGVPPSGPMDALALRLANRLLGNEQGTAALECTASGPVLKFHSDTVIALAGAPMDATLDGKPLAFWQSHAVTAGSVLKLGRVAGAGLRAYLAVSGGFDVPDYLGAKATFTLGGFGGHAGRTVRVGDMLHFAQGDKLPKAAGISLPPVLLPRYSDHWEIAVLYGPHGAPDFFTAQDIDTFFATEWEVHYNSSRTGVRLIGPKPQWARRDGGEAGLHPSNIHDNAYAIGAIDFTGDMPVILGPDGPSLGGFVCPAVIADCELWKLGQLKPGDRIRFRQVTQEWAASMSTAADRAIESLALPVSPRPSPLMGKARYPAKSGVPRPSPVLHRIQPEAGRIKVTYRQSGDRYLLVEYGPLVLDLNLRFRVHALMCWVQEQNIPGVIDLTPGIRSLQVHFDGRRLTLTKLLDLLVAAEKELPSIEDMEVPTRVVHLPLSWDDAATRLAIEKYSQSVRKDAPWCPSNIEFIRRINGLGSIEDVHSILFDASYLVLGLGDVYLGRSAPPAGDHQIQSGAHVDAGKRRRHRRRLSLRLWHGRAGWLPVRRPHPADVEPLQADGRICRRQAMAAALLRPDPLLSGHGT